MRHCVRCDKEFQPTTHTSGRFCSTTCYYAWNKASNDVICAACGKEFHRRNPRQRFCSWDCAGIGRRLDLPPCVVCGKPVRRKGVKTCSQSCGARMRAVRERYPVGATRTEGNGYVMVRLEKGWVAQHRQVMAESLGRPLADHETIHHINGKRDDNRLENLQLRSGRHGKGAAFRCLDCGSHNVEAVPIAVA